MSETNIANGRIEERILDAAKELFIERGFYETHMGDIAKKVGITRPALHYYFRTKETVFQAVFGPIVESVVPKIKDLLQHETPLEQRIGAVVDVYYEVFAKNPGLPLFVLKEINRDAARLMESISRLPVKDTVEELSCNLRREMEEGRLRKMPLPMLFYTFYGLLTFPFLTKNLGKYMWAESDLNFEEMLAQWKPCLVAQMKQLLTPPGKAVRQ